MGTLWDTDAGAHKLYGSFAYSWHKTLCKYWIICIMDSSCCLNCPVAAFYLIMKKNKECETRKNSMSEPYEALCQFFPETTSCERLCRGGQFLCSDYLSLYSHITRSIYTSTVRTRTEEREHVKINMAIGWSASHRICELRKFLS